MATVALVLGAGGLAGGAWLCGVLDALHDVTGWDARQADLVVGTSAGARVGATLRLGFSPADHYAQARRLPLSEAGQALAGDVEPAVHELPAPAPLPRNPLAWRPSSLRLAAAGLTRLPDPRATAVGWLPRGNVPTDAIGEGLRALARAPWPEHPTWVTAVRLRDGRRVVFGRDAGAEADLATAVEASAAVPAYFSPVDIDGEHHIDGGTHSVTNTDLVAGLGFDLAVVLAPMAAAPAALRRPTPPLQRALHARILARQVTAVRRSGTAVLALVPPPADIEVLAGDPLDGARLPAIAERARASAAGWLTHERTAERVALLRRATARRTRPADTL